MVEPPAFVAKLSSQDRTRILIVLEREILHQEQEVTRSETLVLEEPCPEHDTMLTIDKTELDALKDLARRIWGLTPAK